MVCVPTVFPVHFILNAIKSLWFHADTGLHTEVVNLLKPHYRQEMVISPIILFKCPFLSQKWYLKYVFVKDGKSPETSLQVS